MKLIFNRKSLMIFAAVLLIISCSACSGNDASPKVYEPISETSKTITEITEQISDNPGSGTDTTEPASENNTETTGTASEITSGTSTETPTLNTEIVLATYNIKHGAEGLENVAEAIREFDPDIIGLEEVDVNCDRSGNVDEPAELARLAGYSYYAFSKATNLSSGEYGTAILSRYPIESFEVFPLYSGNGEDRSLGHAVININGLRLDTFVTHLSYEDRSLRIGQMETIAEIMKKYDRYVLLADLNSFDIEDIGHLGGEYYVNRPDRLYITFSRWDLAIDNIVVSKGFSELSSGLSDKESSDHKLLYAVFKLSGDITLWAD